MRSNALLEQSGIADTVAPLSRVRRNFSQQLSDAELMSQAAALAGCFQAHGVTTDHVDENIRAWREAGLPDGASDIRPFLRHDVLGQGHEERIKNLMNALKEQGVMKYSWGEEHYRFLKPEPRTVLMLHELERMQRGSIIFVPVGLEGRHNGLCAHDARRQFADNEFGLGVIEGGCYILSQRASLPKRGLKLMYIGDTYNPGPGSDSRSVPCFVTEEHDPTSRGMIYLSRTHVEERDRKLPWQIPTAFAPQ